MAQFIEVTEKDQNGNSESAPNLVKSLVVHNIESAQAQGADTLIFMAGRGLKDVRTVDEDYATVLAAINAAPTADVQRSVDLVVKKREGELEERVTPYNKAIEKNRIVEFYENPNAVGDSVVIVKKDHNRAERVVYYVDNTYASLKSDFDA